MIYENKLKKTIEKLIETSSNVFIVGHNEPDFDAIGSAIGLQVLSNYLNKKSYIVIDDIILESGVKRIIDSNRDKYSFINKNECLNLLDKKSLLILTDVNANYMISLKNDLDKFNNILIIDHHKESNDTVKTDYRFIDINKSSSSEIVANLLSNYKRLAINQRTANYLLSGIVLDTHRFRKNTKVETLNAARYLMNNGAQNDYVEDLFLTEFEDDKKISDLVFSNTIFRQFSSSNLQDKNIAFVLNREEPKTIYKRESLAKAADKLMKYKVDASFALGYINKETVSVSGRSRSDIDVADILSSIENVQGGGNPTSAGAKANNLDPQELEKIIINKTTDYLKNTLDNQYVLKKNKKY